MRVRGPLTAACRLGIEVFAPSRPHRGIAVLWLALTALVLSVLFVVDPVLNRVLPPCPFRVATGLECPGCGTARALHELLHGRPLSAFRLNPLLALFAPFLLRSLVSSVLLAVRGRPLPPMVIGAHWIWALLAITLTFWVVRNTPLWQ